MPLFVGLQLIRAYPQVGSSVPQFWLVFYWVSLYCFRSASLWILACGNSLQAIGRFFWVKQILKL